MKMAEFCLDCWNKIHGRHDTERELVLTRELDLCEGCGQWKRTVVTYRGSPLLYDFMRLIRRRR